LRLSGSDPPTGLDQRLADLPLGLKLQGDTLGGLNFTDALNLDVEVAS
jgi:hypothetical protein